jgi:AcrR family transcriptional regulator
MKVKNKKREALLVSGKKLFWKHGFKRVTIDEICRHSGVSKMTFYRWFNNKTEFAKTIYENEIRHGIERFKTNNAKGKYSAAERFKAIITLKLEGTTDISREFLNDFYNSDKTEIRSFIEELTLHSWQEIIKSFRIAQEKGWFRKDFKPEFILFYHSISYTMFNDKNLQNLYNTPQDMIMEFANFSLMASRLMI